MTWNPHKMMGAPLQCAMFLTKHKVNKLRQLIWSNVTHYRVFVGGPKKYIQMTRLARVKVCVVSLTNYTKQTNL